MGYKVISRPDAVVNSTVPHVAAAPVVQEDDATIIERLRERFSILDDMTYAVKKGDVRAMIVSGPPGVGKSFGIEAVLAKADIFSTVAGKPKKYEIIKGAVSPICLYQKLYEYSDNKSILVFDDCDAVLMDELSLNLLKAALDTSKKRTIHWNTESRILRENDLPNSFEFHGGVIFVTNIKFANVKSKKLKDHLEALESRCHYLDLTIDTEREKMLRIKQIIADGLLDDYGFSETEHNEIVEFVETNKAKMRELSLRTVIKAAGLYKSMPARWQRVASMTLMK
jgi:hypothetical protein